MAKLFDAIHGFIELNELERKIIQTLPFQRLRAINQIPTATFIYSGGSHKRFDHSIGTMHVVGKIFDKVSSQKNIHEICHECSEEKLSYWQNVVRAAALCHDLGHLPLSHLAEEELIGKKGHEEWTMKIMRSHYLKPIFEEKGIDVEDVIKVAVGPKIYKEPFTKWELVLTEMLTGDCFGGDRVDYLLRDAYYTGLSYGRFDYLQLIDSVRLLTFDNSIVLGLEEDGIESCYALLLARFFMHCRLYQYPRAKSYSYHLKEFVIQFFENKQFLDSVENYIQINDFHVFAEIYSALFNPSHKGHEHAKAIMDQSDRVSVVSLTKKEFEKLMQDLEAASTDISFEKNNYSKSDFGLSFPVLLKSGIVTHAQEVADVPIPRVKQDWVYISPRLAEKAHKKLQDVSKGHKENFK